MSSTSPLFAIPATVGAALGLPLGAVLALLAGGAFAWLVLLPILVSRYRKSVRQEAESLQRLQESERKYEATVEAMRDALASIPYPAVQIRPDEPSTGQTFSWVNSAAIKEWKRSEQELTSVPYASFLVPEDVEQTREYTRRLDKGGSIPTIVNHYVVDGKPGPPQEWLQFGDTGFWMARPLDREAKLLSEVEAARKDIEQTRELVFLANGSVIERARSRALVSAEGP